MKRIIFILALFIVTVLSYAFANSSHGVFGVELSKTTITTICIVVGAGCIGSVRLFKDEVNHGFFEFINVVTVIGGGFLGCRYLIYAFGSDAGWGWWVLAVVIGVLLIYFTSPKAPARPEYE